MNNPTGLYVIEVVQMKSFPCYLLMIACFFLLAACGREGGSDSAKDLSTNIRIVNGTVIPDEVLPFTVRVLGFTQEGTTSLCTGSFLTPTQVLTAAHCLSPENEYAVLHSGILSAVTSVSVYPNYSPDQLTGDLAIITVQEPYTGPLAILGSLLPFSGQELMVAGFGTTGTNESTDLSLRNGFTTIDTIALESGFLLWAFDTLNESNTCFGDSGGPGFVRFLPEDPWVLVSITTGGIPNCDLGSVSFNTILQKQEHFTWILEQTDGTALVLYY